MRPFVLLARRRVLLATLIVVTAAAAPAVIAGCVTSTSGAPGMGGGASGGSGAGGAGGGSVDLCAGPVALAAPSTTPATAVGIFTDAAGAWVVASHAASGALLLQRPPAAGVALPSIEVNPDSPIAGLPIAGGLLVCFSHHGGASCAKVSDDFELQGAPWTIGSNQLEHLAKMGGELRAVLGPGLLREGPRVLQALDAGGKPLGAPTNPPCQPIAWNDTAMLCVSYLDTGCHAEEPPPNPVCYWRVELVDKDGSELTPRVSIGTYDGRRRPVAASRDDGFVLLSHGGTDGDDFDDLTHVDPAGAVGPTVGLAMSPWETRYHAIVSTQEGYALVGGALYPEDNSLTVPVTLEVDPTGTPAAAARLIEAPPDTFPSRLIAAGARPDAWAAAWPAIDESGQLTVSTFQSFCSPPYGEPLPAYGCPPGDGGVGGGAPTPNQPFTTAAFLASGPPEDPMMWFYLSGDPQAGGNTIQISMTTHLPICPPETLTWNVNGHPQTFGPEIGLCSGICAETSAGTLTFVAADASHVAATYDFDFGGEGRFTGSFDAVPCSDAPGACP